MKKNKIPFLIKIAPYFLSTLFFHSGFFIFLTPFPIILLSLYPESKKIWPVLAVITNLLLFWFTTKDLLLMSIFSLILWVSICIPVFIRFFLWKPDRTIVVSIVSALILAVSLFTLYAYFAQKGPLAFFKEQITLNSDQAIQIMKAIGQKEIPEPQDLKKIVFEQGFFVFFMFLVLLCWGNVLLAFRSPALKLYQKVKIEKDYFRKWKLSDHIIWFLILFGSGAVFFPRNLWVWVVSINALKMVCVAYALQGLSITAYFLNHWKIEGFLRVLIYIVIMSTASPALVFLGVLDLWFDFREKFGQINISKEKL